MRRRTRWTRTAVVLPLLAAALLGATPARAQPSVEASVDRAEATVDERIRLVVTVTGSRSVEPTLPELPDFEIYPRGQETRFSWVNGRATSSVSYNFLLEPRRTGELQVGAVTAEIDGQVYRSKPFTVRILAADERPARPRDVFVTVKISNDKPYVGQQVIYTWRLYRRVNIADARLEPQSFDGFLVEDLGDVREYEATVRGQRYLVSEFKKALFPQEEGPLEIPGSRLTCRVPVPLDNGRRDPFDDLFGRSRLESQVVRTQPIPVEVRPLPAPPPGFTGLVGDFEITTRVSRADLAVGQSTTVEMKVSGTGNPQMIAEPGLPELAEFKVYADRPSTSIERSPGGLSGSRTFRKALVPRQAGELVVPSLELTYFDPESGSYQISRSPPVMLRVAPAAGPEELKLTEALAPSAGKVNVRILADDILPLHRGVASLTAPAGTAPPAWALGLGLGLPPLLYLGARILTLRRRRLESDALLRRRRAAARRARQALRAIERLAGDDGAVPAASLCLRRYIGDKLGVEGTALTAAETEECLRRHGVDEETVASTREALDRWEAAQYAARPTGGAPVHEELAALLRRLGRRLPA
ncbi:MAG: BatD family protein [Thermoanaerobaculia bacterium]|nr:BatD family protein [Thermoanaerobaculia bacterium]